MKFIWKFLKTIFTIASIILIFAIIGLVFIPLEQITEKTIRSWLHNNGFPDAELSVSRLNTEHFSIDNMHLGDEDRFHIEQAALNYTPEMLLEKKISSVQISGLNVNARLEGDKITFGNIDKIINLLPEADEESDDDNISEQLQNLIASAPFKEISIINSSFTIIFNNNRIVLPFEKHVKLTKSSINNMMTAKSSGIKLSSQIIPSFGILSIDGNFDISCNLKLKDEKVIIENAAIQSASPGKIKLIPDAKSVLAVSTDDNIKLLATALKDFDYQNIRVELKSDREGKLKTNLFIEGSNQDLYNNRPVKLNLNYSVNLFDLLKVIFGFYELTDKLPKGK